jgi:hypothetical protein
MHKKSLLIVTVLLLMGIILFAQNDNTKEIEQIYLQNPELMVVREQLNSADYRTKLQALESIQEMVKSGTTNIEIENLLITLGQEGSISKKYSGLTLVNNFPEIRRQACKILGEIGSERAKTALIAILLSESDVTVMAEAAYALGVIGSDEKGEASGAIGWMVQSDDSIAPDNNFAYAAILALEKIAIKNNGLKNMAGYAALINIAQGNYLRLVKEKALEVIKGMAKYNK